MRIRNGTIPQELAKLSEIESILSNDNDYTNDEIQKFKTFSKDHLNLSAHVFAEICKVRPKKVHENVKLFSCLDEKLQFLIIQRANPFFKQEVAKKFNIFERFVDQDIYTNIEDIEIFFYDDLNSFQNTIYMKRVKNMTNDTVTFPNCVNKIDLAAFLGASKIFNFLFKAGSDLLNVEAAIAGGNQQIIQRLITNGFKINTPSAAISFIHNKIFSKFFWYSQISNPQYITIEDIFKYDYRKLSIEFFKPFIEDKLDNMLGELVLRCVNSFQLYLDCHFKKLSKLIMEKWDLSDIKDLNYAFSKCLHRGKVYFIEFFLNSPFCDITKLDSKLLMQAKLNYPNLTTLVDQKLSLPLEFPLSLFDYQQLCLKYIKTKDQSLILQIFDQKYAENQLYINVLCKYILDYEFEIPKLEISTKLLEKLTPECVFLIAIPNSPNKDIFEYFKRIGFKNLDENNLLQSVIVSDQFENVFGFNFALNFIKKFDFSKYFDKRKFTIEERKLLTAEIVNNNIQSLIVSMANNNDMRFHMNIRMFGENQDNTSYLKNVTLFEDEINYMRKNMPQKINIIVSDVENREKLICFDIVKSIPFENIGNYLEDHIIDTKSAQLIAEKMTTDVVKSGNKIIWRKELYPYLDCSFLMEIFKITHSQFCLTEILKKKSKSEFENEILQIVCQKSDDYSATISQNKENYSEEGIVELLFKANIDILPDDYDVSTELLEKAINTQNDFAFQGLTKYGKTHDAVMSILQKAKAENNGLVVNFIKKFNFN